MPKKRKSSEDKPLKTLRILCEGEKTEPIYINSYLNTLETRERRRVVKVHPTRKNTPLQLVEEAIDLKKSPSSLNNDEFWVVYDRESTAKYSDKIHLKALKKAKTNSINVALNNVCFEFWVLLHFGDTSAPYSSYDDLRKRSNLNGIFLNNCGIKYEKAFQNVFPVLKDKIPDARKRALKVNREGLSAAANGKDHPLYINPYAGMVELLDAIDNFR